MEQTTTTTYSDLPMKIISYIFSYLSHTDGLQAGSTCKRWRDEFFENNHKRTGKVHFAYIYLSDSTSPGKYLLKSQRSYRTFHFKRVTFEHSAELIAFIAQTAVNVIFDYVDISNEQFRLFMRHATNLESLTIRCCSDFIDRLFMDYDIEDQICSFASIRHLSLRVNGLCDSTFRRITSPINILESLDMSGCKIVYQNAIEDDPQSDPILSLQFLADVILIHRKNIKELNLSNTGIIGRFLELLAPNEEKLDCIKLYSLKLAWWGLDSIGITSFLKTQPQLVVLNLAHTKCVNDGFLKMLVETSPMIEDLNIWGCNSVTNEGCAHLGTLRRLKRLNILECYAISDDGLRRGVARTINTQLHHLQMSAGDGIKCIALNCLELRLLEVNCCNNGIPGNSLKYIWQHLRRLRDLTLTDSICISNADLTGISVSANGTISFCEQFKHGINVTTTSIRSLKGLRRLNLTGCFNITDDTLVHSIKFAELTDLNLSDCHQISSRGIQSVALNCPSIERLNLSRCDQIKDRDIRILIKCLSRLKNLCVDDCSKLTQNAFDAIDSTHMGLYKNYFE